MLLKHLINNCPNKIGNIKVKGLSLDSRKIKKGELFFAIKGSVYNGNHYIDLALKKGACAVISSEWRSNYKIIYRKNIEDDLANACKVFFKEKPKNIIAVTGTNGKSSVADFFHQILSLNNVSVATIGTLGVKIKNFRKTQLTSLDIISLHRELKNLKTKKINNVLIEASSHGLDQGRLLGLKFKAGIFTNFSQDHLDYHKSMRKYLKAKLKLFSKYMLNKAYVITDSSIKEFKELKKIAVKKKLKVKDINSSNNLDLSNFKLLGFFQRKNLMMSIKACEILGIKKSKIMKAIKKIKSIKGRLELVRILNNNSKVYVDFAHTPKAVETVIETLKKHYKSNLTIVIGCGGERDNKKRSQIGKVINKLCDKIYITDDNPRNENPRDIRKGIIKSLKKDNYKEIGNRAKAIKTAILNSNSNEIILIAGKGHEETQSYGDKIIKISDQKIVNEVNLKKKIKLSYLNKNMIKNKFILNKILNKKIKKGFLGVSIDSRTVKKNNLFIAIKGKKKDGNLYTKNALKNGASLGIVSDLKNGRRKNKIINVKNTYSFLKKLAEMKRKNTKAKIISITGSSGKTSVKDMVGRLINYYGATYFSPKSYNNSYGVPLSLCNLEDHHLYGVFEIGMSKKGEIERLSRMVCPEIGVITNVAEAHIENFKNLDHIAHAKGEIINNIKSNGHLILDRDGRYFNFFKKKAHKNYIRVVSIGFKKNADIYPIKIKRNDNFTFLKVNIFNEIYEIKIKNNQMIKNILISLGILKLLNLNIKKIINKIKDIEVLAGRGKVYKVKINKKSFNLMDESYNANPLSMRESILKMSKMDINDTNKYLLLGDMLELGNKSNQLHKKISKYINNSDIDKLFIHGKEIMNTYKSVKKHKRGNILQTKSDFAETILPLIRNNDYLLIKGSNATGLNLITKYLIRGRQNVI